MSVCVITLVNRHAKRFCSAPHYTALCPVWLYRIFPHYFINGTILEKKIIEHKLRFDFLCNFCMKHFSFWAVVFL